MVNLSDSRREWLEKVSELKKKKEKELEELEEKKKKELAEAEEMLKAGIEDLTEEEIQILEKLREEIPALRELETEAPGEETPETTEDINLEEVVASEKPEGTIEPGAIYGAPIEETIAATRSIYEASNYNIYDSLKSTLEKIDRGEYLRPEERETFYKQQERFNNLKADQASLADKDKFGYVDRSKQIIQEIDKSLHASEYKISDDHI